MNIDNQIDDAGTQIDIKLDRIAAILAVLFERFQPETSIDSIPEHHLGSLADSAIEELAQVRALLASDKIMAAMQAAV